MASDRFANQIGRFLTTLKLDVPLPDGFEVLDPYKHAHVRKVVKEFAAKYYTGDHQRLGIWGINPGRFGGGVTGLSFTDPFALREIAEIESSIEGRRELSAEFVWMVIEAYGGPKKFYHDFYLGALSPLGYEKAGKNINFYDDKDFLTALTPTILRWVRKQEKAGLRTDAAIVLGTGKLQDVVKKKIPTVLPYQNVVFLEHPRFIMQYRRKRVGEFVEKYLETLSKLAI